MLESGRQYRVTFAVRYLTAMTFAALAGSSALGKSPEKTSGKKRFDLALEAPWARAASGPDYEVWKKTDAPGSPTLSVFVLKAGSASAYSGEETGFDDFVKSRREKLEKMAIHEWTVVKRESKPLSAHGRSLPGLVFEGTYRSPKDAGVCFTEWQVTDRDTIFQITVTEKRTAAACDWSAQRRLLSGFSPRR